MRRTTLMWAVVLAGQAQAGTCDALPPPSVIVRRIAEPVTLNVEYGYKSLGVLAASLARPGKQVLGLTRGKAVVTFESNTLLLTDRAGQWECASPQLLIRYGFKPLTVYVANEFPPGSCAYRAIYAHEIRHVDTYLAHLEAIEDDLTTSLRRRFATGAPWRGPSGQTRTILQRELEERWVPYMKREIARVEAAQALIDTPEEYAKVAASCDGEIRKRVP